MHEYRVPSGFEPRHSVTFTVDPGAHPHFIANDLRVQIGLLVDSKRLVHVRRPDIALIEMKLRLHRRVAAPVTRYHFKTSAWIRNQMMVSDTKISELQLKWTIADALITQSVRLDAPWT